MSSMCISPDTRLLRVGRDSDRQHSQQGVTHPESSSRARTVKVVCAGLGAFFFVNAEAGHKVEGVALGAGFPSAAAAAAVDGSGGSTTGWAFTPWLFAPGSMEAGAPAL